MQTTKQDILNKSYILLMQQYDKEYTVDALASDLKRSKKTIYKFFNSKNKLVEEVFDRHRLQLEREFYEIEKSDDIRIEKLVKQVYRINYAIKEIRLSRWYQQAKRYVYIKDKYFQLRAEVFEVRLRNGLSPFNRELRQYGKAPDDITNFTISSLEQYYFHNDLYTLKREKESKYVDQLLFLLHGCLISIIHD